MFLLMEDFMREFIVLILELLFIALIQTIVEAIFDAEERKKQMRVVNIACILISYLLLIRFVYNHLLGELTAFVGIPF